MTDPISAMTEQAGDTVWLKTATEVAAYDPSSASNYAPGAKPAPGQRLLGCIADKKMREGLPAGATTAFTISTKTLPPKLQPMKSYLLWKGITYLIVDYRQREYRGAINGYTLFLKA